MPVVNPLARELVFKVVYYGPGLGGKTTTLQHIHTATRPEYRGKMVSLATPVDRTLYFDFLPIRVPSIRGMGVRLQLFTVPGQVYYNATRKLVLTGADGVVLVADSQPGRQDANLESLENLEENLREHGRSLQELPLVLQYNKRDLRDVRGIDDLERELNPRGVPSLGTVATSGVGVFEALDQITRLVLADFERRMPLSSDTSATSLQVPEGGLAEALRRADYASEAPTALSRTDGSAAVRSGAALASAANRPSVAVAQVSARPRDPGQAALEPGAGQVKVRAEPTASQAADDETSFAGLSDDGPADDAPADDAPADDASADDAPADDAPADDAPASSDADLAGDDEDLPRLTHTPASTIGEEMARSVSEFGAPRRAAESARLKLSGYALVPDLELDAERLPALDPALRGPLDAELRAALPTSQPACAGEAAVGFSFSALFPRSQQRTVRQLEEALATGHGAQAVERAEQLVTRTFAAAASLVSQKEAPRDPTLVALMLGLAGQRYLEFRAIARDARAGGVVATEDALIAYAFAVDARLAWRRVGGRGPR